MANNNDWLINLVGSLDPDKTKKQINDDIKKIQDQLNDVELKAKLGSAVVSDLEKQLSNLQVSLTDITISQSVLNGLVNQINNALQGIKIPNINISNVGNNSGKQAGKQTGSAFNQGFSESLLRDKSKVKFEEYFKQSKDAAKEAQTYFQDLLKSENATVTVLENFDDKKLNAFTVNVKRASGEVESLHYQLRNLGDNQNPDVRFSFTGGKVNDVNVVKQFEEHSKIVTDFKIKLEKLKATYANANVNYTEYDEVFKRFENGSASVNELRLAFNKLESDIKTVAQGLKSQSASLDPIQQALNNMRDLPSMLTTLQSNMDGIKDKTSIAGISVQDFTEKYNKLYSEMSDNKVPLTEQWIEDYRNLMSSVTSATKQVDALKKAESSDNSQTQKQASYYSTLLSNYREIYSLKKKLISAGEEESRIIERQISQLKSNNDNIYKQLDKQNLRDEDWQEQVHSLKDNLNYNLRISKARQKDKDLQSEQTKEQQKTIQITKELTDKYQKLQDIKAKISSLDKNKDSEKISALKIDENNAQKEYEKSYDKLTKSKNFDKASWEDVKQAIDEATQSKIRYNESSSTDKQNNQTATNRQKEFNTLLKEQENAYKAIWEVEKQIAKLDPETDSGEIVGLQKKLSLKEEAYETTKREIAKYSELSADLKHINSLIKIRKDAEAEIGIIKGKQSDNANEKESARITKEIAQAEKERLAYIEKQKSASAKAQSNKENARIQEANSLLSQQKSAYQEIWNIHKKISSLDPNKDSEQISALNEKKKIYQDIFISTKKQLNEYVDIVSNEERLISLAEIRKKAEKEIAIETAKQNEVLAKAQSEKVNKIQHLFDNGYGDSEYGNRITKIQQDFEKYGLSAEEAIQKTQKLRDILNSFKDTNGNFLPADQLVAQADKLEAEFDAIKISVEKAKLEYDKFLQPVSNEKTSSLIIRINSFLTKNTNITKEAKEELQSFITQINGGVNLADWNKFNSRLKEIENQMRQADRLGKSLWQTFKESASKFAQWTISSGAVMDVWNTVRQGVEELKNLDSILTEISKTSDLTTSQLKELGDTAFESASKYGKSASEYLTGVQEMYRAGFDNASEMAELSLLAQAAGDMDADSANDYLIATNAAYDYKNSVEELNKVLDSQNYITNNSAIALQDMADATSEAGSIAAQYGVEINELSALIAVAVSKTRESGSEVGTALKSLFVNLQDTTNSSIVSAFDAVDVSMTKIVNGSKQLKTPIELIKELSVVYNSLPEGDEKRANILNDIAGKYHANTFAAILSDLDSYNHMLELYSQGMGSAAKEAEKSANNWSGSLEKIKNSMNDLIQNFVNSDVVVGVLNTVNDLVIGIDKLTESFGTLGTIGLGGGLFAGIKNVG